MLIQRFTATNTPAEVAAALREDGCCIIEGLADADLLARFESEMRPWMERTPTGFEDFTGTKTKRTGALVARSAAAHEMVMNPLVRGVVDSILPRHLAYQLHLTQIIAIGPGETAQPIHRDQWGFDFFRFPEGFEVQCNTIWALTDFTEANGATRVVPGSNRHEDRLTIAIEDTIPAEMKAGSVLLYTGALYHGGGPNSTNDYRAGINITYSLGWLRQEENQYLACPQEIARTLDDDLLRLMGYTRGAFALGYVDDLRDPLAVLKGESPLEVVHAKAQSLG